MKFRNQKREKPLEWMTVICKDCSTEQHNHIMYVRQNEIKTRCTGYKGKLQFFVTCTKCGKDIILEDATIPRKIWNFLWEKAYQAKE